MESGVNQGVSQLDYFPLNEAVITLSLLTYPTLEIISNILLFKKEIKNGLDEMFPDKNTKKIILTHHH